MMSSSRAPARTAQSLKRLPTLTVAVLDMGCIICHAILMQFLLTT
jgi:hypothetical protein